MGKENPNIPLEQYATLLRARLSQPETRIITIGKEAKAYPVTLLGQGPITTDLGEFRLHVLKVENDQWRDYQVLTYGGGLEILQEKPSLFVRVDSGCESGQTFRDRTCDCQEQLQLAMAHCVVEGAGAIVHIPHQDGRGQGLAFKMATLELQAIFDIDTVTAFQLLGSKVDTRNYDGAVAAMLYLGIGSKYPIALGTNNPHKIESITQAGIAIDRIVPVKVPATDLTKKHFQAKKNLGHNLDV